VAADNGVAVNGLVLGRQQQKRAPDVIKWRHILHVSFYCVVVPLCKVYVILSILD